MRRTRSLRAAAGLEGRVTHRLTRTLPMARSAIRCQGAVGAGRAWELMQQHSHRTGQLQVSPLVSWDQRCHCNYSWACTWQRRTKQNPVRFPLTAPIPVQSSRHRAPSFCSGCVGRSPWGSCCSLARAGEQLVDAEGCTARRPSTPQRLPPAEEQGWRSLLS